MYNASANDLERVANDLSRIVQKYTNGAQELDQQVITLEGAVAHVLAGGVQGWKGLSADAFLGAWLERKARLQQASLLMNQSAGYLSQMLQTLEEQIPSVRADENIMGQSAFSSLSASAQSSITNEMSQAQMAIITAISMLNSHLEQLAEEVSDCPEEDRQAGDPAYYNNISKSDAGGDAGAGGKTPEQRIQDEVGDPVVAELLIELANEKGANLEDVLALLKKGASVDQVYQWLENGTNLNDVAILLKGGADINYINAWIGKGINIGSVAKFVDGGINPDMAVQLTRANVNPDTVLPLIREGVAPETIMGLIKSGVAPEKVGTVVEANIANLIKDSNPKLPLTRQNAISMLKGPPGTYPRVAGSGGQGADVEFIDPKTGDVVLAREEKSITSSKSFDNELSDLGKQLKGYSAPRELFVEVPRGTNAKSWIGSFLKNNDGAGLSKYKGLEIVIVDPDGTVLWEGQLVN